MTRAEALKRLAKLYGSKAYWHVSSVASSPEKRTEALAKMRALRAEHDAIDADIKARLKALDWYQELLAKRREVRDQSEREAGAASHYKFSIGRNIGWANEIAASGDTWEECFAAVEQKAAKAS